MRAMPSHVCSGRGCAHPVHETPPSRFAARDELDTLPVDMAAEMLTQRLGFLVTPAQVRDDRAEAGLPCTHFETDTQPEECMECVCADCGAWVGARVIRRNDGLCDGCIVKGDDSIPVRAR